MIMEFTFYPYTRKNVENVEERWGVYKLADDLKRVIFIGRGNIKKHLSSHLPDNELPVDEAEYFQIEYYDSGEEAYEAWKDTIGSYRKKWGTVPEYNEDI
jgi:hypothetical protein